MESEVTAFLNRQVYTRKGHYVGIVQHVILDLPNRRVGALVLGRTNVKFVEGGYNVAVPYRWVASAGDIVILSHFPEKIVAGGETVEEEAVTA